MTLKIISAEDVLFEGEVSLVNLPGTNNHASLVSTLVPGNVRYVHDGEETQIPVSGGLVDVDNNVVSVCIY